MQPKNPAVIKYVPIFLSSRHQILGSRILELYFYAIYSFQTLILANQNAKDKNTAIMKIKLIWRL